MTDTEDVVLFHEQAAAGGEFSEEMLPVPAGEAELKAAIRTGLEELDRLGMDGDECRFRAAMRLVMDRVRGRVPGRVVAERVRVALKEVRA